MNTEAYFQAKDYWNNLSHDDRLKILLKYNFWLGFKTYLWDYIPEDLKTKIIAEMT
jgi:lipopolysaccharide biosynthesis glycosyltransferase